MCDSWFFQTLLECSDFASQSVHATVETGPEFESEGSSPVELDDD